MECVPGITNSCPTALAGPASNLFLTLINTLLASRCALKPEGRYPTDYGPNLKDGEEFDFVVVGSGSAGSVVASRLSDNKNWNVLLLEAGDYPSAATEIPAFMFSLQNTKEDWNYTIERSENYCAGLKDQMCRLARGRGLGGSSLLNAMIYNRGNRHDYDEWAKNGNAGWDYDSVLESFKKFEHTDLLISRPENDHPFRRQLLDAYEELGHGEYSESKPLGILETHSTIFGGTRSNTAKAFISKVKDRPNLHVAVNAHVTKLVVNKQTKTVEGVEVQIKDRLLKVKAVKEVVLSAGSINSPQILMNSGIGPKDHLKSLDIEVIKDLKVGENLQDHVQFPGIFIGMHKSTWKARSEKSDIDDMYQYFVHRRGPLSMLNVANVNYFVNHKNHTDYPDIQIISFYFEKLDPTPLTYLTQSYFFPDDLLNFLVENNKHADHVLFFPILLKPKSRGKILLRSSNPFDKPRIITNYMSDRDDEDLETILNGVKTIYKLIKTKPFLKANADIAHFDLPNCRNFKIGSDDYWRCAIRNIATTIYHAVGTCKMGPKSDPTAIVDSRLRVHGIKGLRVIDGSIMPTITATNTNAPIIMIGEKGAEFIREDWRPKHTEL